ncbi:hypothetical protein [Vagococcus bubulae]|uniref:Uncharacterized protein n=1 Tax=Vagococcus bubulae TaxID=1977868 RepID=A0A429ZFI3_9ENTE|nr:hypothetical protein [Vagococcus bubulae]RST92440.1 hypothetical protein CBF36_08715 [Vagococcus bubulae]
MFPCYQVPQDYLRYFLGTVEFVEFSNNVLTLKIALSKGTESISSDIFVFNLNDKYVQRAVLSSIGRICWSQHVIDFSKIIGAKVLITYREGQGLHHSYSDLIAIQVINLLQPYASNNQ